MSLEKYLDALKKEITFSDIVYERQRIDEAGTAHPLPGHDYHKKTDAELHFIARDAKEAEDAMSGHNPKAANKYADQKNDAATILHFRKKGMPDWYKKKYGHIKEETEIDEAAKDLPTWKLRSLVKNEIGGKENAEELARRQKEKKAGTYKSHSSDDAQAGVKDAKNFREETEIVEDNSALDAMDAKEKRKDKIRKFIKNQSPVKAKHTPGKQTVQKEEIELDEALKGGEKAAYDMGFAHGRKNSPKIDANKSFGSYSKHYHDGYHAGKSSAETEDWHEEQKSKRFRREEVELEESEKNKRINQALADTERYIEKESKRDPKLRPKEVQDRLDFYVKHREKLKSMIESVNQIDELSDKTLSSYRDKAKKDISKKVMSGDFDGALKRDKGITKSYVAQGKKIQKEEIDLDEAVEIAHDRVLRSHGKKNTHTGHALWMFTNKRTGDVDYDNEKECHQVSATRKDAQKSAKEWAKKHGHSKIYFMENVEYIEEALPPHLAKHFDEKGNLKDPKKQKSFEEMMKKKIKDAVVKDVTPAGYGPKNEEAESIDELSNELLDRYKKAAGESAREADKKGDFKKGNKRFSGIIKATKKQFDNDEKHSVKENVDINENKYSSGGNGPSFTKVGTKVKIHTNHKNSGKVGVVKKITEPSIRLGKEYHVEHEDGTHEKYYREHIRRVE